MDKIMQEQILKGRFVKSLCCSLLNMGEFRFELNLLAPKSRADKWRRMWYMQIYVQIILRVTFIFLENIMLIYISMDVLILWLCVL